MLIHCWCITKFSTREKERGKEGRWGENGGRSVGEKGIQEGNGKETEGERDMEEMEQRMRGRERAREKNMEIREAR